MRIEVVHLNSIEEQKASDEIVQREAKTAGKKIYETNSLARKRRGKYLFMDMSPSGNDLY